MIEIETKKHGTIEMDVETFTRWACLIEAVEKSGDFAERNGVNMDKLSNWIKPNAFRRYVAETYQGTYYDIHSQVVGFAPSTVPPAYYNDAIED